MARGPRVGRTFVDPNVKAAMRLAGSACALLLVAGVVFAEQPATPADPTQLTLSAARGMLSDTNRQIRLARRAADVATAEIGRVNVRPNPTVSAELSNVTARHYAAGDTDRILRVEQLFERGGKRELRAGVARKAEAAARMDLADVTRQQRAALAGTYYELVASQRLVGIADENLAGARRLLDAGELRLKAGDVASVDVSRLRVEASRAANEARTAREALGQARLALAELLGMEGSAAVLAAVDDFPPLSASGDGPAGSRTIEALTDEALERRADASAARARIEALATASALARSQRTRDVTLGMKAEYAPSFGGTVFGVTASLPLFLNNDFSGDIARAQAELEQAREDLERVRGAIRADIARSQIQLASAHDRARTVAEAALPEAARAAQAVEFAYRRGAASLTDLFDARRQFAEVRADAITAHAAFAKALAAFREAIAVEDSP